MRFRVKNIAGRSRFRVLMQTCVSVLATILFSRNARNSVKTNRFFRRGAAGYGLSHRNWAPPHSSRQREAGAWEADVELRTSFHHEAGHTVPPAPVHLPTKSNSGSSTTTQQHNHSSLRTSSHLPSSSNTHNTGSWDRWQFWDVDTARPCFWQTSSNNRQRSDSLAASIEEIGRTPSDPYPSAEYDPFKVTPPCVGLELLHPQQDRPSRSFCARAVRICAWVTIGSILTVAVLGVLFWFSLGGAEYFKYYNYKSVNRLLNIYPSPKGQQLQIRFRHGARVGDPLDWRHLVQEIDDLLEHYNIEKPLANTNLTDCGWTPKSPRDISGDPLRHCIFDIRQIDRECSRERNYGYEKGSPCVFLQFSADSGFHPKVSEGSDIISLECFGNTATDQDHMGSIAYTPDPGFKLRYFPAEPSSPYMAPLVAIRFIQPTFGVGIGITCNIFPMPLDPHENPFKSNSSTDLVDSWNKRQVHFNLLID